MLKDWILGLWGLGFNRGVVKVTRNRNCPWLDFEWRIYSFKLVSTFHVCIFSVFLSFLVIVDWFIGSFFTSPWFHTLFCVVLWFLPLERQSLFVLVFVLAKWLVLANGLLTDIQARTWHGLAWLGLFFHAFAIVMRTCQASPLVLGG